MASRYSAQGQSLFGGVGGPQAPRAGFDGPGTVDALVNGVGSLIHRAMLRRQAEHEIAAQDEERQYRRGRDTVMDQRYGEEQTYRRGQDEKKLALDAQKQRRDDLVNGIVPAHTEADYTPDKIDNFAPAPAGAIMRAMLSGGTAADAGKPYQNPLESPPIAPSSIAPTRTPGLKFNDVPESYDPTRSAAYTRQTETARIRGEVSEEQLQQRLAAQQKGREYAFNASKELATLRANLQQRNKNSPINRAMTANAEEAALQKYASGYLATHNGNLQDAIDGLETTREGIDLAKEGMTRKHLLAAYGQSNRTNVSGALGLVRSGFSPTEAAATVDSTRSAVRGPGLKGPPKSATDKPVVPPLAPTGNKPKSGAKDDFTTDELADAFDAGKTTDKDIADFVRQQRAKKAGKS